MAKSKKPIPIPTPTPTRQQVTREKKVKLDKLVGYLAQYLNAHGGRHEVTVDGATLTLPAEVVTYMHTAQTQDEAVHQEDDA